MGYWCPKCQNIFDNKFDKEKNQCKQCNHIGIICIPENLSITMGELLTISNISIDKIFCQSMIDLKEKDPIEYQLKMSQFKSKVQSQQENSNKVCCPKCGSTSISTGARGVNHFWGFIGASKTVNRCANCGYTWKP